MKRFHRNGSKWTYRVAAAAMCIPSATAQADDRVRVETDFESDVSDWTFVGDHSIEVVDSHDATHGKVLELRANGDAVYALARGSEDWGALRVEADFRFPSDDHSYLGLIYNFNGTAERTDFGNVYIKGNGSYLRANPVRDGNVSRLLYEEYRTPLFGPAAIMPRTWHRLRAEIDGPVCHIYVDDMTRPRMTFDLFERTSGAVGFKPRCVGGPVWIDNVRITAIDGPSYLGPPIPDVDYRIEELVTDWQVLGPLTRPAGEIETEPMRSSVTHANGEHGWRPFATDRRGAVITGQVTEFFGDEPVAYFRTLVRSATEIDAILHVTTTDELAVFVNGIFEGFLYRDGYVSGDNDWNAWYDFWSNAKHAGSRTTIPLRRGENVIVLRVRNGHYASGGFFARLETEDGERLTLATDDPVRGGDVAFPVEPEPFIDEFTAAEGIAFNASGELLITADYAVWRAEPDGSVTRLAGLDAGLGLAGIGASDVLAADFGPTNIFRDGENDDGIVWRVTPDGEKSVAAAGIADPNFILVRADGSFLVSDDGTDRIYLADERGAVSVWTDEIAYPNGMVLSLDGSVLYVAQIFSQLKPIELDNRIWGIAVQDGRPTGAPWIVARAGDGGVDGLALDERGRIYVADNGGGKIWRIDPESGETVLIAEGIPNVASLAFGEGFFDRQSIYAACTYRGGGRIWVVPVGVAGAPVQR